MQEPVLQYHSGRYKQLLMGKCDVPNLGKKKDHINLRIWKKKKGNKSTLYTFFLKKKSTLYTFVIINTISFKKTL